MGPHSTAEDLVTTKIFIFNPHCSSCVPTIKYTLSGLPHPPAVVDVSIISQCVTVQHSALLSRETIENSLYVAGFDLANMPTTMHPLPQAFLTERITKHVEQCAACTQELSEKAKLTTEKKTCPLSGPSGAIPNRSPPLDVTASGIKREEPIQHDLSPTLSRVQLSVGGMTCASCVSAITRAVSDLQGVSDVSVNLLGKSASAVVAQPELVDAIVKRVEEIGYECDVVCIDPVNLVGKSEKTRGKPEAGKQLCEGAMQVADTEQTTRIVTIRIGGMFCQQCPPQVMAALLPFSRQVNVIKPITSHTDPILRLSYTPASGFTIRTIMSALSAAKSPYSASILHPPSPEELAHHIHEREQKVLLIRLAVSVVIAIPTFVIGIVYMTLLRHGNAGRMFSEDRIWVGQVSRGEWVLFILATPVMFYCAWGFHHRSIKELVALWRRGSPTPLFRRFIRFGSMNLLISMGVSIAYVSSIASLAMAATRSPPSKDNHGASMTYFDSVVFLTMFLLIGRYLEAFSKSRAANSVSLLGQLRGTEALLLVPTHKQAAIPTFANTEDNMEKGYPATTESFPTSSDFEVQKVHVDLLEVGDIVRVQPGSTPPADGTIVSDEVTNFDESSLTGESRVVKKGNGDRVFVGTINKLRMVEVRVDAIGGETMLDKIVTVIRHGNTKRAPIERLADVITGYFVPVITLLAISTWVIWLGLGVGGALSDDILDNSIGGWPIWSLEFAVAVFVIACPCGIGLAAPTAILVGSGLAAKFGILARGGGAAFQEAAQIDLIVFDKTGTLTEGGEPKVTDELMLPLPGDPKDGAIHGSRRRAEILRVAASLESASSHTLATAIASYCKLQGRIEIAGRNIEETAGRGLKGLFRRANSSAEFEAIIGNEAWMEEHAISLGESHASTLNGWKLEGKSVVLLAIRATALGENDLGDGFERALATGIFTIVAMFAVADPVRKEAQDVIARFQAQGVATWMISGDNATTAKAVARTVGIPEDNVIAGVLPQEKVEQILWLQKAGKKRERSNRRGLFGKKSSNERCIVAMVGDGINDAPALTTADVGIAMGSGSDIAISSAEFILVSSNLYTLLTLTDLSRKVFNRVKFNFFWAIVYNLIAIPVAAGVIYPDRRVRLSPVWSSLAMALSSTSVVCSSLLLKLYKQPSAES